MMGKTPLHNNQRQTIVDLQQQIREWGETISRRGTAVRSTGCAGLDGLFPQRGVCPGSLVEWIGRGVASGVGTLSLLTGWRVRMAERPLVIVDSMHHVSPLALATLGCDLTQVVIVRPRSAQAALWVYEESLRCEGVGLVWGEIEQITGTSYRRLQLAAEASGVIGFLVRSEATVGQPSWAETRLSVQPRPRQSPFLQPHSAQPPPSATQLVRYVSPSFRVEVIYGQGRAIRSVTDVMIDGLRGVIHDVTNTHETDFVSLVS